jgi:nucleotide-binding universal stress UspA family protein
MVEAQQLMMEPTDKVTAPRSSPASGIKTILLQVVDNEQLPHALETGLALARACSAHLSCLHVAPIEAYVAFDGFGGVYVMNDIISKLEEQDVELRARIEKKLAGEDVSWDYEQVTGNVEASIIGRAALADLLIVSRRPPKADFVGATIGFLGELLHRSSTPLYVPGSVNRELDPTGPALIAWNGSFEAANAVRASLGLLKLSRNVQVLEVCEETTSSKAFPGTKLLEYLSRQGVHAELCEEPSLTGDVGHDAVAGMIRAEAAGRGAQCIVMGGYSHARISEYVFGGVTRSLLKDCPVGLVITH